MTRSVIHYWCLPQLGWWIIKPLIRPGNSAAFSTVDTHLHNSHTAVFHRQCTNIKFIDIWLTMQASGFLFFFFLPLRFSWSTSCCHTWKRGVIWAMNKAFQTGLILFMTSIQQLQHQHSHRWKKQMFHILWTRHYFSFPSLRDRWVSHMRHEFHICKNALLTWRGESKVWDSDKKIIRFLQSLCAHSLPLGFVAQDKVVNLKKTDE